MCFKISKLQSLEVSITYGVHLRVASVVTCSLGWRGEAEESTENSASAKEYQVNSMLSSNVLQSPTYPSTSMMHI